MAINNSTPPGAPGIPPRWTTSSKSGIGKSTNDFSCVIFTISHGILNETYYPREDVACIRDMGFIVTDGESFFSEEKRDATHEIKWIKEGVPAYRLINTCNKKKYTIKKEIISDPYRDSILQKVTFKPTKKEEANKYKLFVLLAPHIGNRGAENNGWLGEYKGVPMLFANRLGITMALACFNTRFLKRSVGYVGTSDGWQDLHQHHQMEWEYARANNGNIALCAEIDLSQSKEFVLALSFGLKEEDAGNRAWASLIDGFEIAKDRYLYEWNQFQKKLKSVKTGKNDTGKDFRVSATVMNLHQSRKFPGGVVASLSIPWGNTKGDNDLGGYHLVWPRDLVESAGGFLALKSKDEVLKILNYLMATQEKDGHWSQNMWLEGIPSLNGIQMDEVALPLLLVEQCRQQYNLHPERLKRYWPTIKKAISFIVSHGPSTDQDRWEEEAGLSSFTLAAEITGLLCAANLADEMKETDIAGYCRETADFWNEQIENWTYITDTPLSKEAGVDGYYMRINPFHLPAEEVKNKFIYIKNRTKEDGKMHLYELVCVDALALVRFGLRAANDPRILNTVKLIDDKLKVETPNGTCWHRYTNDGYGEDEEGNGYSNNGKGIGRAWPLLTGERAHYEIAAGNIKRARELLHAMEAFANNGLIPEQIWDTKDIPEKELFFGKHSGSAMPLTWAHSEYIKLCYSVKEKKIFDMSSTTHDRYLVQKQKSPFMVWRFTFPCTVIHCDKILRIETSASACVHWTTDDWQHTHDTDTKDSKVGMHIADIDFGKKKSGEIKFTFFWKEANHWENKNYEVKILNE